VQFLPTTLDHFKRLLKDAVSPISVAGASGS
jgi:hypothetical protein